MFGELTVAENIAMPTWTCPNERPRHERIAEAYEVFPKLERYRDRGGQALSGGERKMVSIARALALGPEAAAARRADRRPVAGHRSVDRRGPRQYPRRSATRCSSPNPTSTTCRTSPTGSM